MLTRLHDILSNKWISSIIGILIAGGFVFWGVNFHFNAASYAAKVNGDEIPLEDFQRQVQQQESQYQQLYKIDLNDAMRTQIKHIVLDQLVQQKALQQRVNDQGYRVSDQSLAASIRSIPAFQVDGKFNMDSYRAYLRNQGMSDAAFTELERQQLALVEFEKGVTDSSFMTPAELNRYVALMHQKRRFGYALFKADDFTGKVKVADDEVADYYKGHHAEYMTAEAVGLEYIELTRDEVASGINVTDDELQQYYNDHKSDYSTPEERHADHILITPKKGETDAETKARAEAVLKRVQGGEDFAKVAKEVSQDPGTADQGGDLGWIGRGMLKGPFEDTLFSMKVGDVKGPVKTDFGYHIIKLVQIRGGAVQPFAEVKDKLLAQVRKQRADDVFYERSNKLADEAFDAYDSLDTVGKKLGLPVKTVDRFPRSGDPAVFMNSAPIVDAVFGAEPLEKGMNSGLLKLSDNDVVVVNVAERYPPKEKPLDEVKAQIRDLLVHRKAASLASAAAAAFKSNLPKDLTTAFLGQPEGAAQGTAAASADAKTPATSAKAGAKAAPSKQAKAADKAKANKKSDKNGGEAAPPAAAQSEAAKLAAASGGSWVAPKWVERTDSSVPAEVLAQAFDMPSPVGGAVGDQPVSLAAGDRAVILLADVQPGKVDSLASNDLDEARQSLGGQISTAEFGGYATSVRDEAKVRVPASVLETQQP
ncbi:MAG TPA: SurA N-terminal domain-containing protein [Gammaproteobacteria bacterium]|nr:SurA N-terminal domain-containing protein [Gammaproteobacteria bacterium]